MVNTIFALTRLLAVLQGDGSRRKLTVYEQARWDLFSFVVQLSAVWVVIQEVATPDALQLLTSGSRKIGGLVGLSAPFAQDVPRQGGLSHPRKARKVDASNSTNNRHDSIDAADIALERTKGSTVCAMMEVSPTSRRPG